MRLILTLSLFLGLFSVGCGPKAVEFDPEKTVPFDKNRDTKEELIGGGLKSGKKTPKNEFIQGKTGAK